MFKLALLPFFVQPAVGAVASYTQLLFLNKGFSQSLTGVLIAVGTLFQIVFPILISMYVDKHSSEKKTIALLSLATVATFVSMSFCSSGALFIALYFLAQSLFWNLNTLQDAFVSKCLKKQPGAFGRVRSVGTVGYVLFMTLFALTGFPDSNNNRQILLNMSLFSALSGIAALFQGNYEKEEEVVSVVEKTDGKKFDRAFFIFIAIITVSKIAQGVIDKLMGDYIKVNLGLGNKFTLFVALGAIAEFFVLFCGSKLVKKGVVDPVSLLCISALSLVARMLITAYATSIPVFCFAQMLHGLGFGACHLAITAYIAKFIDQKYTSEAMTIYWSVSVYLAAFIGTFAGGFIIDYFGYKTLFASFSIFPLVSAILCFCFRNVIRHLK